MSARTRDADPSGSTAGELNEQVGRLLQAVRARGRLSQEQLAERAATSQQWVSRVERGAVNLRLTDAERLFAAVGARLTVQTLRSTGDAPDPDLLADGEAAEALDVFLDEVQHIRRRFQAVPHVVGGRVAALAQGMPVRPARLDLIIGDADVEGARQALGMLSTLRWSDRHQEFRGYDDEVGRPGERRWMIAGLTELRIEVAARLPESITVVAGRGPLTVVPLTALLRDDEDITDLSRRLAARSGGPEAAARQQGSEFAGRAGTLGPAARPGGSGSVPETAHEGAQLGGHPGQGGGGPL